jgi:hypothetical protein
VSTEQGPRPDDATPTADPTADPTDVVDLEASADPVSDVPLSGPSDLERSLGSDPAYVDDSGELPLLVPARERFAGLDAVPVTGEPRVDAATARLEEIVALPTVDHVEIYEDVHQRLQDALADADSK